MIIFNVRLTKKNDDIFMHFDTTSVEHAQYWSYRAVRLNIKNLLLDKFHYQDTEEFTETLDRQTTRSQSFKLQGSALAHEDSHTVSSTYRFPKDPILALDFLSAFEEFINESSFQHVSFHPTPIAELLTTDNQKDKIFSGSIAHYLCTGENGGMDEAATSNMQSQTNPKHALQTLMLKLLMICADIPAYTASLNKISAIYQFSAQDPVPFSTLRECLEVKSRYAILLGMSPNSQDILTYVVTLAEKLIKLNRLPELEHFIRNFQTQLKLDLFRQCLGKIADDNGQYGFNYTEWSVLENATFNVQADGIVCMPLLYNQGYVQNYAIGNNLYSKLESEMRHMFNIFGLHFNSATDFHDTLIFDKPSSEKLLAMGMHLSPAVLTNLLMPKNKISLFSIPNGDVTNSQPAPVLENRL